MEIEIFGTGCARCKRLAGHVRKALNELNINADVRKVEGLQEIMERGVMMTPALAINGKMVLTGKASSLDEVKELIRKN